MADEEVASASQIKRMIRSKLRKRKEAGHEELNIYPMMDMMTILLVFLIMQFSQTVDVVESEELRLPYTIYADPLERAVVVKIARNSIAVNNETILALDNGLIDDSQRQGGGNSFVITPLLAELEVQTERLKAIEEIASQSGVEQPFNGDLEIIADKRTPYRTIIDIVYTAGQAEFRNFNLVAIERREE